MSPLKKVENMYATIEDDVVDSSASTNSVAEKRMNVATHER